MRRSSCCSVSVTKFSHSSFAAEQVIDSHHLNVGRTFVAVCVRLWKWGEKRKEYGIQEVRLDHENFPINKLDSCRKGAYYCFHISPCRRDGEAINGNLHSMQFDAGITFQDQFSFLLPFCSRPPAVREEIVKFTCSFHAVDPATR